MKPLQSPAQSRRSVCKSDCLLLFTICGKRLVALQLFTFSQSHPPILHPTACLSHISWLSLYIWPCCSLCAWIWDCHGYCHLLWRWQRVWKASGASLDPIEDRIMIWLKPRASQHCSRGDTGFKLYYNYACALIIILMMMPSPNCRTHYSSSSERSMKAL